MPLELQRLGRLFASTAQKLLGEEEHSYFTASACIVNYYHDKSNMGGHRDDLEMALDKPIVSCSLGRPAVFLLGGQTREEEPVVPIVVRPGDVMVLGGDCRLHYHSMARLLSLPSLPAVDAVCCPDKPEQQVSVERIFDDSSSADTNLDERGAVTRFLSGHRINLNLRQVYPDD